MPDVPRTVRSLAAADGQAIRFPFACIPKHSMTATETIEAQYVPLSQRTSDQLLANAEELRRMARTATTFDVARALMTLADRYAALAAKRRGEEVSWPPEASAR